MPPAQAQKNSYLGHTDAEDRVSLSILAHTQDCDRTEGWGLLNHDLLNSTHSSKMILRRWRGLWDDDSS